MSCLTTWHGPYLALSSERQLPKPGRMDTRPPAVVLPGCNPATVLPTTEGALATVPETASAAPVRWPPRLPVGVGPRPRWARAAHGARAPGARGKGTSGSWRAISERPSRREPVGGDFAGLGHAPKAAPSEPWRSQPPYHWLYPSGSPPRRQSRRPRRAGRGPSCPSVRLRARVDQQKPAVSRSQAWPSHRPITATGW